jgi:hypothetical protein
MPYKDPQKQKIKEIDLLIEDNSDSRIIKVLELVKQSIHNDIMNHKETVVSPFIQ